MTVCTLALKAKYRTGWLEWIIEFDQGKGKAKALQFIL